MTRGPRYSILLPTHNRADVLPFAIRSVLAQSTGDFELLIVGDGCTDGTAEVATGFGDDRIRWFDLPKGPGFGYGNRNVALRQMRGTYVAFAAHDDLWLPDHLESLATCLEAHDVEWVYSRPLWVIPPGRIAPVAFNLNDPATLERFLFAGENGIPAPCVMHRRECLEKYGYWDETLPSAADHDMWRRIILGRSQRRNFAYQRDPTTLHFRANWRTERTTEPRLLVWTRLHETASMMPSALTIQVPPGAIEQEAAWLAISAAPEQWSRQLREGVAQVLDRRVALSDDLFLELLRLYRDKGALGEFAPMLEQPALVADALAKSRFAAGTRFTDALRRLKRRVVPAGTWRGRVWSRLRAGVVRKA